MAAFSSAEMLQLPHVALAITTFLPCRKAPCLNRHSLRQPEHRASHCTGQGASPRASPHPAVPQLPCRGLGGVWPVPAAAGAPLARLQTCGVFNQRTELVPQNRKIPVSAQEAHLEICLLFLLRRVSSPLSSTLNTLRSLRWSQGVFTLPCTQQRNPALPAPADGKSVHSTTAKTIQKTTFFGQHYYLDSSCIMNA